MINYEKLNNRYKSNLLSNRKALKYLLDRGLNLNLIKKFELGFAESNGYEIASREVEEAGLLYQRDNGSIGSFFNNRIMIPIRNVNGDIAGFTGRTTLTFESIAKYKNSKDSKQFNKSELLYNLNNLGYSKSVIIFEGQLNVLAFDDFASASQFPQSHPIATGGTALTEEHVKALKDAGVYSVFLCFDNDKAGKQATLRAIKLLKDKFMLFIVPMPRDTDMLDLIGQYRVISNLINKEVLYYKEYVGILIDEKKKRLMEAPFAIEKEILELEEIRASHTL